jgi:glycosyltransferase involved in cell wall biosynthesis
MDELAEAIEGRRVSMTVLYGPRFLAPLRYLALFIKTLILLFQEHPKIVYAQNPPAFCPFTCLIYCRVTGSRLIIDHHSVWRVKTLGNGPIPRLIGLLERLVAQAADANTAPHESWAAELKRVKAKCEVIHDFVEKSKYERDERIREKYAKTRLIAISSHGGHPLERIETEALAAGLVDELTLLITGPTEKLSARLSRIKLPSNVKYLGFLERDEYERIKASSDFAINITDEPLTLSHVLFEYAASSLPIISSRQRVVEEIFGDSILYAYSLDVKEVYKKIQTFSDAGMIQDYRNKIMKKYDELTLKRRAELRKLEQLIYGSLIFNAT